MIQVSELRDNFSYDPATGQITRVNDSGCKGQWKAGRVVGTPTSEGYLTVSLHRVNYKAHRVAWALMTGVWPARQIDHINRARSDNRWVNLREASNSENLSNSKKYITNRSGYKGVWRSSNTTWAASVRVNGKANYLGSFGCPTAAFIVRSARLKEFHGKFARSA